VLESYGVFFRNVGWALAQYSGCSLGVAQRNPGSALLHPGYELVPCVWQPWSNARDDVPGGYGVFNNAGWL